MANVKNSADIILGSGRMYIDGISVGQLKDDVTFDHEKENYDLKAGFPQSTVLSIMTEESLTSEFNLLETNLAMIRRIMPEYAEITETSGTGTATDEAVTVYSGKHTSLAHGGITAVTSIVKSDDTALVEGTDYYLDRLNGTVYRVADSVNLDDGDSIKASYSYATFESSGFGVGGASSSDVTFKVEFYHKRRDGKYRRIRIWKAQVEGNFTLTFKETSESPLAVKVTAIADSTKPAGQQFMTVMDVPAEAVPGGGW